tara:strand:- start:1868 stop:2662 length:795 start_codon:yes stop_codon:yes gene_type:complete
MLKKRLIFTLIYSDGFFMQSRNFRLQRVGNIEWLLKNYKFQETSFFIDELIILDASRVKKLSNSFLNIVEELAKECFIPISVGGGIKSINQCKKLFNNGADKIVLNSILTDDPESALEITSYYGGQSVVASIDVKKVNSDFLPFKFNGSKNIDMKIRDYMKYVIKLRVGEIYLNSIDRDGTGFGFDTELLKKLDTSINLPLIVGGGAGNYQHFIECFKTFNVEAASTANLYNFIGDGLAVTRNKLIENKINIPIWGEVFENENK